jgi:hypothetical protein
MLTCTLCPRSVRLSRLPPSLRICRQHVGGVANVCVVLITVLLSLSCAWLVPCTWVGPCSNKRQISVRLWYSYITWARQIRKFAYLVLPVRLLGFSTEHQRAATCPSPGAGKGPPGCASTGWAGTGFAGKVRAGSCPARKDQGG